MLCASSFNLGTNCPSDICEVRGKLWGLLYFIRQTKKSSTIASDSGAIKRMTLPLHVFLPGSGREILFLVLRVHMSGEE